MKTTAQFTEQTSSPVDAGLLQRKCDCGQHTIAGGECTSCQDKHLSLQRATHSAVPETQNSGGVPPIVHDVLRSPGQPLDAATRSFFEPRFGHDFSGVRVHTDPGAAESARAVNALAYTKGNEIVMASEQYSPTTLAGRKLLAHELSHVLQQEAARSVPLPAQSKLPNIANFIGRADDPLEQQADRMAEQVCSDETNTGSATQARVPQAVAFPAVSPVKIQRQPAKTTVRVESAGSQPTYTQLTQGKGGSGAVVYNYSAHGQKAPDDKKIDTPGKSFDINLPVLVYPPAVIHPPTVDLFVFFHGMRADYKEGPSQGSEQVNLWSQLKEAVGATNRIGIAPQAPVTWIVGDVEDPQNKGQKMKAWKTTTAHWHEALANIGFDGLIDLVLKKLTAELSLATPLNPGTIHVAGHSAGGHGIGQATDLKKRAKTYGDSVQDVTLQDAGYNFEAWPFLMDWFLHGSPGKTIRVLISQSVGGTLEHPNDTRSVMTNWLNVKKINKIIDEKGESGTLEAQVVSVPAAQSQKPRPGGFILESELVVKNKTTGAIQGTMAAFFAPAGGHYDTVTASMRAAAAAGPGITTDFLGEIKVNDQCRVIARGGAGVYKDADLDRGALPKRLQLLPTETLVTITDLKAVTYKLNKKDANDVIAFRAAIKDSNGNNLGWTALANLTQTSSPATAQPAPKIQPKRTVGAELPDEARAGRLQAAAARGISGSGTTLPYLDQINHAFGSRHDLSGVRAHLDQRSAAASRSMGAVAYTVGKAVAFDGWPDLHTAAHEAAHVVQQRRGVSLPGGVGRYRDSHEQHADAVADAVIAGRSVAPLLDGPRADLGSSHIALQHKDKPSPEGSILSSELDPMDTPEETAFMVKVYDAQQQWAVNNRTFTAGIPDSDLLEVEDGKKMHKSAAPDAKSLLDQARTDLATQQAAKDERALKVTKIGVDNAYRGMAKEKSNWQSTFRKHFKDTAKKRAELDGGEFGDAAVQLLVGQMRGLKAIPGFSNHSKGLAVDFMTTEKGLGTLGPDSDQREFWKKSWFWNWLNANHATYHFSPLSTEEWHWDHS
jgi:hypothetical protein